MNDFIQKFGIHPLGALAFICIDAMLFIPDATIIGWVISIPVGMIIAVACFLLQKFAYKDDVPTSIAKSLILGLLTAIPTPLPSVITGVGGVLGMIGAIKGLIQPKAQQSSPETLPRIEKDVTPAIKADAVLTENSKSGNK